MEIGNTIYNHSKREKYLSINLTKQVQDLYAKDYKTLIIKLKEDVNKWRDILCSRIKRLSRVKVLMPHQIDIWV